MNEDKLEQLEKRVTANNCTITSLGKKFRALSMEWGVYEDEYKKYLAKRNRIGKFLWWLYCKMTFRSIKLSKKELIRHTAKKMAHIFYEGGR